MWDFLCAKWYNHFKKYKRTAQKSSPCYLEPSFLEVTEAVSAYKMMASGFDLVLIPSSCRCGHRLHSFWIECPRDGWQSNDEFWPEMPCDHCYAREVIVVGKQYGTLPPFFLCDLKRVFENFDAPVCRSVDRRPEAKKFLMREPIFYPCIPMLLI